MKSSFLLRGSVYLLALIGGLSIANAQTFSGDAGAGNINPDGTSAVTDTGGRAAATANPLTWKGDSTGGVPSADETTVTPIDGVNHDFFILTVNGTQASWAGKVIFVRIFWAEPPNNPADDYDLFAHKDTEYGPVVHSSAGGAPQTEEKFVIDPSTDGVGVFYINTNYFTVADAVALPYTGTATVQTQAAARTATYTHGGITFSPNSTCKAPTAFSDGEPSSRVDIQGNHYIVGIRGVPAGVDLWYFDLRPTSLTYDPKMRVPIYRGQPDSPSSVAGQNQLSAGALGGGDIDLAVGTSNYSGIVQPGQNAEAVPALAYASLTAANVTVGNSLDRGKTFRFNGAGNIGAGVPINDRQWMGFFNNNIVYLVYRNFLQGIAFIQQSTDAGFSYGPAFPLGGIAFPQTGALDVDLTDGTVYVSSNDGHVAVGDPANNPPLFTGPTNAPQTYTVHQAVPAGVDSANIFFPIRVATVDHTVYGTYSDGRNIFRLSSSDKGVTWTSPVQVNDPADPRTKVNLMPWLAVGPTSGSVGVAWYATSNATNDDNARYRVYFAQSFNAKSNTPSFRIVPASDHTVHAANISLKGLVLVGTNPNRNLLDYFQINFDPTGAAVIGYTDDHNDFNGETFVARQISGPSINGNGSTNVPAPVEGSGLPAQPFAAPGTVGSGGAPAPQPIQPAPNGAQVTDFAQDQDSGLLAVTPTNSPVDILAIRYSSHGDPRITATMRVSDLTVIPPRTTWRMFFAANAPETGIVSISGNRYSKGLSDRGDQFYVQAATDTQGTPTFTWGTAVRNFDGSITTTSRGTADRGSFNQLARTISVGISTSALNAYLAGLPGSHPPIVNGTILCGLRGNAFQTDSLGIVLEDYTRGGTQHTVGTP